MGVKDILQTDISSNPDAMTKFGKEKVQTQLAEYIQSKLAEFDSPSPSESSKPITRSVQQVVRDLKYRIPKKDPASDEQSTSQDEATTKADDEETQQAEVEDKGFKIRRKMKLDADARRKIVARILDRDLDPSGMLVDEVRVRHNLKPYGLNENMWRSYLLNLTSSSSCKNATLAQIYRELVMELEPKITEVELIIDCEKKPLEPQALKECKLYLSLIKADRHKIKNLVNCFSPNPAKRQHEKSGTSDSETDTKHQNQRASRTSSQSSEETTDRACYSSRQRDRELKSTFVVNSQQPSTFARKSRFQNKEKVESRPYDMTSVSEWCTDNHMLANASKTKAMLITTWQNVHLYQNRIEY